MTNYISKGGVIKNVNKIRKHIDPRVSNLAGRPVKVYAETIQDVIVDGKIIGQRVEVIPLTPPTERVSIMTQFIETTDPILLAKFK